MQKISTYLYPNRIQLLADLASFATEFTNVYQRTVKIYQGVDNVIEFDIKNADQKRIELVTDPIITDLKLSIMDASGKALPSSPYDITPSDTVKGIAVVQIPKADLDGLSHQFLRYSVTAVKDTANIPLYADTRFGAAGTIELLTDLEPKVRPTRTYTSFTAEIDLKGQPTYRSSAIPVKFYEAVPTGSTSISVNLSGFTGSVWVEATKDTTISVESFKKSAYLNSYTFDNFTGIWESPEDGYDIGDYQYFRVSYSTPLSNGVGASFKVDIVDGVYNVSIRMGGTGYAVGSQIKVLGSTIGGTDGVNDLIISVDSVDAASTGSISSYSISSINTITWTGIAISGNATYIVTGTNITGKVDKVVVE
jgi:hypothetical protein